MPDPSQTLQALGIALVAVVLLWFALGTQANIRRGNAVMRWLQGGLPLLGPRATVRWLGSSVAELGILEPRAPFRGAEVKVVLQPRDMGALWALARARGRRDFLLLRADLVRAPRFRADLIAPAAWTARDRRADDTPLEHVERRSDASGGTLEVRWDAGADVAALERAWNALGRAGGGMWRISVRQLVPHLEVHVLVPPPSADARAFLDALRDLAVALTERR